MKSRSLLLAVPLACTAVLSHSAQGPWTPLPIKGGTKLWADSNSWVRNSDGTVSVRLRIIEGRVDGGPSEGATIQYMDFNCTKSLYRLRRTELVRGEKVVAILPDSMGSSGWKAPSPAWLEDLQLQAACSKKP